ncbi:MAG TPA: hypothetical protein VMT90_09295 [Dehalococcoidia bacterium]|jgi:hypothetical protein|nr:hypothetical protein [Dehalococcoidia bacterium]
MKLGLERDALRQAVRATLLQMADEMPMEEKVRLLTDTITQALDLNNRTIQRQLEQAGLIAQA